jgi:hypothetical protein
MRNLCGPLRKCIESSAWKATVRKGVHPPVLSNPVVAGSRPAGGTKIQLGVRKHFNLGTSRSTKRVTGVRTSGSRPRMAIISSEEVCGR